MIDGFGLHDGQFVAVTAPKPSYKKRPGLLGGPSKGFRGLSSLQAGYHASTAPENFFKARPAPCRNIVVQPSPDLQLVNCFCN